MIHIKLRYLASLRDTLGMDSEQLSIAEGTSVQALRRQLVARGALWQKALSVAVRTARNFEVVSEDELLAEGDEVAFFPPVTGG